MKVKRLSYQRFLLSKKISWRLLIFLFIFDNFFSYYAITQLQGREANLLIAYWVETYPWLYFFCIPATILIMYYIVLLIKKTSAKILTRRGLKDEGLIERIILSSAVIYWAIGNSSLNLAFLSGFRQPAKRWIFTSVIGILLAVAYAIFILQSFRKRSIEGI
jgi:hypothetical protein